MVSLFGSFATRYSSEAALRHDMTEKTVESDVNFNTKSLTHSMLKDFLYNLEMYSFIGRRVEIYSYIAINLESRKCDTGPFKQV